MLEIPKTFYNGFDPDNHIQLKEEILSQKLCKGHVWFDSAKLEKLGCALETNIRDVPLEIVDIGELDLDVCDSQEEKGFQKKLEIKKTK